MTSKFKYLDILLHLHRNKFEHPKEKLIILVHWAFLDYDFRIAKGDEFTKIIDWKKSEKNTIDIDYLREDLVIHIEQSFDNENYFIHMKMSENNQFDLKMPLIDYINENDGSLMNVLDFIVPMENEIYDLILRQKLIDTNRVAALELLDQCRNRT